MILLKMWLDELMIDVGGNIEQRNCCVCVDKEEADPLTTSDSADPLSCYRFYCSYTIKSFVNTCSGPLKGFSLLKCFISRLKSTTLSVSVSGVQQEDLHQELPGPEPGGQGGGL